MSVATHAPAGRTAVPHTGTPGLRLIRSEISKIFSTNAWWLFGIGTLVVTGLALWANLAQAAGDLATARGPAGSLTVEGAAPAEAARAQAEFAAQHDLHTQVIKAAGNIFTAGQFFGLMLVLLLTALVVTNEYQYQTATATFLTTPHRSRVVLGKLVAGTGLAMLYFVVTLGVDLVAGLIFFNAEHLSASLGEWPVQRAILFNALGYLAWAVLGIGLGTLIRNQIGSVVTSLVVYLVGYAGTIIVFQLIRLYLIHRDGVLTAAVAAPSIASQVMISPEKLYPQSAAWWVGALVMLGWSILAGGVGVMLTRRRDIS